MSKMLELGGAEDKEQRNKQRKRRESLLAIAEVKNLINEEVEQLKLEEFKEDVYEENHVAECRSMADQESPPQSPLKINKGHRTVLNVNNKEKELERTQRITKPVNSLD